MTKRPCPLRARCLPGFEGLNVEQLLETTADFLAEARWDRAEGLIRNVALLGPESRNGYRYTREAMQQAAPLYEGRPVFIDHRDTEPPTQRSLRDYAGQVVNPRFENERVRGDLRLLGPNTEWLMSLLEAAPNDVGMSHVVLARRNPTGNEVEQIERVISVDIVAFPATTHSFKEATAEDLVLLRDQAEAHGTLSVGLEVEQPRSSEKPSPLEPSAPTAASPYLRRAVVAAIRGN